MNKGFKDFYLAIALGLLIQGCMASTGGEATDVGTSSSQSNSAGSSSATAGALPVITASLSSSVGVTTTRTEIPFTINFSKSVNFKDSDLTISGGRVFNCVGTGLRFNCTLVLDDPNVSVQIIAGSIRLADGSVVGSSNVLSFVSSGADKVYGLCFHRNDYFSKYQTLRF